MRMKGNARVIRKCSDMAAKFAMTVTAMNVNAACGWVMHQPKLPERAERLKKHHDS